MKAYEFITEGKINLTPRKISKADFSKVGDMLGYGMQAFARKNKQTANTIIKVIAIDDLDEANIKFVELCVANNGNPFFPIIYNAKLYEYAKSTDADMGTRTTITAFDGESKYKLVIHQERLHTIEDATTNYIEAVVHQLIGLGFDFEPDREDDIVGELKKPNPNFKWIINSLITELDWSSGRAAIKKNTKNTQLKKALSVLEPYFREFNSDMHEGNVMIRFSPAGPQLVIIDPFGNTAS